MKALFTAFLVLISACAFAHPHVWVDSVLKFKNNRIDAVWTFDEMFSQVMLNDFDVDKDGVFTGMEVKQLKQGMFDNLSNFDYFMRIYCGNEMIDVEGADNFGADTKDGRVTYRFSVKLSGKKCGQTIELYNYDDTLYTAIDVKSVNGSTDLKEAADGIRYAVIK